MIPVEMRYLTGSTGQPSTVDETSGDIMEMLRAYAGPFRMSAQNAADLNTNNANAIGESARADTELANALRYQATYQQARADAAVAQGNADTTAVNQRYAETAYAAIRDSFGPNSPYTAPAWHNLEAARQARTIALDLLDQANTRAQPPSQYDAPPHAPGGTPVDTMTYPSAGAVKDPAWVQARADAPVGVRSHAWVDPISRPGPTDSHRYVVQSGFDARRFQHGGHWYTDLTVRVWFDPQSGAGHQEVARVQSALGEGVHRYLNAPGYVLGNGDRLHVTVERVDSRGQAHMPVGFAGRDMPMDQRTWWADAPPVWYAHELAHQLGLRDESRDGTAPHRPDVVGSLVGDIGRPVGEAAGDAPATEQAQWQGLVDRGLRQRHLALLSALIGPADANGGYSGVDRTGGGWDGAAVQPRTTGQDSKARPDDLERLRFQHESREYELRLGDYLVQHPEIAAQVAKFAQVVWDKTPVELRGFLGTDTKSVPGAVGRNREALERVVREGNVREQLTVLWNAQRYGVFEHLLHTPTEYPPLLQDERRWRGGPSNGPLSKRPVDQIQPPLSSAEKAFTGEGSTWRSGEENQHVEWALWDEFNHPGGPATTESVHHLATSVGLTGGTADEQRERLIETVRTARAMFGFELPALDVVSLEELASIRKLLDLAAERFPQLSGLDAVNAYARAVFPWLGTADEVTTDLYRRLVDVAVKLDRQEWGSGQDRIGTQTDPDTSRVGPGEWLVDGLPLVWRRVDDGHRSGVALLSDADWASLDGRPLAPAGVSAVVAVHGADGLVRVPVRAPDGGIVHRLVTPEQLAEIVADFVPPQQPVVLLSCAADAATSGLASRFAVARGSGSGDVLAPVSAVVTGLDPATAGLDPAAGGLATVDGQSWQLFTADGLDEQGYDVVNDEVDGAPHPFDGIVAVPPPAGAGGLTLAGGDTPTPPLGALVTAAGGAGLHRSFSIGGTHVMRGVGDSQFLVRVPAGEIVTVEPANVVRQAGTDYVQASYRDRPNNLHTGYLNMGKLRLADNADKLVGTSLYVFSGQNNTHSFYDPAESRVLVGGKNVPEEAYGYIRQVLANLDDLTTQTGVTLLDKEGIVQSILNDPAQLHAADVSVWDQPRQFAVGVVGVVRTDTPMLIGEGLVPNGHQLTGLAFSGSDFHRNGQQVLFLTFTAADGANPHTVVYKPSSLRLDAALFDSRNSVARTLNPRGELISQYRIVPVIHDDVDRMYGYQEFVRSSGPTSATDLLNVYKSLAAAMAMSYLVGLDDVHHENLLLLKDRVQVIDMEATTGRFDLDANRAFASQQWNDAIFRKVQNGLSNQVLVQKTLTKAPDTERVKAEVRAVFRDILAKAQNNAAALNAHQENLADMRARFVPIATNTFYQFRELVRNQYPTYAQWRARLDADRALPDGDPNSLLNQARGQTTSTNNALYNILVSPATHAALVRGDIPYYYRDLGSSNVLDENGQIINAAGHTKVGVSINVEIQGRRNARADGVAQVFEQQGVHWIEQVNNNVRGWIRASKKPRAGFWVGPESSLDMAEHLPLVDQLVRSDDGTWSADGARVLWRRIPEARDGWSLLSDEQLASRPLLGPGNSVPVLVHPAGELVRAPVRGADSEVYWVRLTPEQLARMMADRLPEDATVALLSCAAGALPDGFAHQFAVASGRDVLAPQSDLFISLDGSAAQLMTVDGDSWLLFTADGSVWDTVNDEVEGRAHPIDGFTADDLSAVRAPGRDGGFTLGQDSPKGSGLKSDAPVLPGDTPPRMSDQQPADGSGPAQQPGSWALPPADQVALSSIDAESGDVEGTLAGNTPEVERLTQELADIRDTAAAVESDAHNAGAHHRQ
jgi:hypothetical protein